ncbi:uncharacterized protein LOC131167692 [Malania oleifera]|uniref:uncharacterized protein LOC131167692 n=1 Tax=Malania oleifera TaxID=397392 RepID=UPI0025ADB95D|nr:uncharacterized protein LOC131167692 [Malania oleifera]
MAGPSPPQRSPLHALHVFSMKSPSSTLSSMKLKTLIHTLILSHVCRVARALSKTKSILIEILKELQFLHFMHPPKNKNKNKNRKAFFGSFRLHYNWCSSSHVLPVPAPVLEGLSKRHLYYDSAWNSFISCEDQSPQLSGYLEWLEEAKVDENSGAAATEREINEIDRRADMFIANCHEKFRLEKQESYRRYQEMLARGM